MLPEVSKFIVKTLTIFGIKHLLLVYRKCWIDWTELVCHEMPIIRRMTRKYFLPSSNILLELWKVAYDSWNAEMATKIFSYKELLVLNTLNQTHVYIFYEIILIKRVRFISIWICVLNYVYDNSSVRLFPNIMNRNALT